MIVSWYIVFCAHQLLSDLVNYNNSLDAMCDEKTGFRGYFLHGSHDVCVFCVCKCVFAWVCGGYRDVM